MRNNQFGLDGTDANGSDLMYDGNGTDNCFSLDGVTSTFPADRSTFAGCGGRERVQQVRPGRDARLHRRERAEAAGSSTRTPPSRATSRSRCSSEGLIAVLAGAALLSAAPAAAPRKTVKVGDNYFTPQT